MTALIIAALAALVVLLLLVVRRQDKDIRHLSLRVRHQARRIRWHREAERQLGADLRQLAEDRMRDTATAVTAPDDLPALDPITLRQVWACSPADFDTPGSTR
ncbi:hypothetical protein E1258_27670 [Micromonospora sp. KC207]|uniref:hypothetical protein n=1 Tax=Micromonospora sp. KC207 TaxID=2530377 RepID=UPI001048131F|nr:hypothetical protein [Micromonospora sp. KC207]TDC48855.1 hypothetical protein E1258_27670 [Micromonospora sp. KC207]